MKKLLRVVIFPPAVPSSSGAGLTFTDILFGLVISELFLRLQNWSQLDSQTRWHLVVGVTLVLGSWTGFHRSRHRTEYEIKFFNLPLFRFLLDQLMVVLYFRMAVLTPLQGAQGLPADELAKTTTRLLIYVFSLYVLWDVLGIWMAKARIHDESGDAKRKYLRVEHGRETGEEESPNWWGLAISAAFLVGFTLSWARAEAVSWKSNDVWQVFLLSILGLVGYRLAKEIRTSWQSR